MIRWFKYLIIFFLRYRARRYVPRQMINPYLMIDADENQRLIMLYGLARSPDQATYLMKKYNVDTAGELMRVMPKKHSNRLKRRFITLMQRMEGYRRGDFIGTRYGDPRIKIKYHLGGNNE